MRPDILKEQILEILTREKAGPLSASQIQEQLDLGGKSGKRVQKCLDHLVKSGVLVLIRKDKYALGGPEDLVSGRLMVLRSGDAWVDPASDDASVFVPRDKLGTALPRDLVVVRLESPARVLKPGRREGKVIRVVERVVRELVGTLKSTGRFLCVVPLSPEYKHDFYVSDAAGAKVNDRVIIRFLDWQNRHVSPEGEIVEVLGPADDPSVDTLSVIHHFKLPREFPVDVISEAESVSNRLQRQGKREDLRDLYVLTIDPARARDFDDALSLTKDADGNRVLGIHIADVGHFIRPGSALDREARSRGNSVYLSDQVIPMLPEQLSNGVCSLRPDEDRLAFSAFLTLNRQGTVQKRRFAKTVIRSRARLTYEEAMAVIGSNKTASGPSSKRLSRETVALLRDLDRTAQQLRARRFARYALEMDIPECEIVMNDEGRMTGVRVVSNDPSHQLVEECMVAANEAVASELRDKGIPFIYRVHEPPDEERIGELTTVLMSMGYQPGDLTHRRNLAAFLRSVADDPLAHHVRIAILKSMKRAVYSERPGEHYGLAKKSYAHFTSPIRRYPDLVVHRQLAAWLTGRGDRRYKLDELKTMAAHCSDTERTADDAERTLIEIKKLRYLEAQIKDGNPEVYEAVVATVTNFGVFVEVLGLQVEGLVHVSALSDQFMKYNRNDGSLRAGRETYRVGTRMRVQVARVDFDKRRVDFVPA